MYLLEEDKLRWQKVLSDKEIEQMYLWDKISEQNLLKVLLQSVIRSYNIDYNSYGEFLFIDFTYKGNGYTVYSYGLHEYRKQIFKENWKIFSGTSFHSDKEIQLSEILKAIEERKKVVDRMKSPDQDNESYMYNELADVCDEDGAMSELGYC